MTPRAGLCLALLLLGATLPAPRPARAEGVGSPVLARSSLTTRVHALPGPVTSAGFAATGGFALVPRGGGVVVAGWNGWAIEPSARGRVGAIAATGSGDLFTVRTLDGETALMSRTRHAAAWAVVAPVSGLPADLATAPDGSVWLLGAGDRRQRTLSRLSGATLQRFASLPAPVTAWAPLDGASVLVAAKGGIRLVKARGRSALVVPMKRVVDGLAVDGRGRVYVSTELGIHRASRGARPELIARGLHGPLRTSGESVYVLSAERRAVVELSPRIP